MTYIILSFLVGTILGYGICLFAYWGNITKKIKSPYIIRVGDSNAIQEKE
jgi:hypothetical protein